jgi:hypothetical protein
MEQRNTKDEKKKKNKGFPYRLSSGKEKSRHRAREEQKEVLKK